MQQKQETYIYLDHAATAPLSACAKEAMVPFWQKYFENPSAIYPSAQRVLHQVEEAREAIAKTLPGTHSREIYFTSGGTEADNLAIIGYALAQRESGGRILISAIEHLAVLRCGDALKRMGYDVVLVPANEAGIVTPEALARVLTPDTVLVSVMYANHEIGVMQPIAELAQLAHEVGAVFHTDAVQAYGHVPISVREIGVDMLSASGHKFGGPKGVGFLYVKEGLDLEPILRGGGQERGLRSGTLNSVGIAGMTAAAVEAERDLSARSQKTICLRELFWQLLHEAVPDVKRNGTTDTVFLLPGHLNMEIPGVWGERLVQLLGSRGICIATGSACTSGSSAPSHVLRSMGKTVAQAQTSVRVTLGYENTEEEVRAAAVQMASAILELRRLCPYL